MLNCNVIRPIQETPRLGLLGPLSDCSDPAPVEAVRHLGPMRGGASAQLMLASDGHHYVVKFQNNPQHRRVLANEFLAYLLLRRLELPVPPASVISVSGKLLESSPNLFFDRKGGRQRCTAGLHFGSRHPGKRREPVFDYLPDQLLRQVLNLDSFLGMVAFDKWVSNADSRQAIFLKDSVARWQSGGAGLDPQHKGWMAFMIDHGFAFRADSWSFQDRPLVGVYHRPWLYERVTGYASFEPWLYRILSMDLEYLVRAASCIPPEWYESDANALYRLIEELHARRNIVPDLLWDAKQAARDPFPNWRTKCAFTRVTHA